jgi:non-specific serine/threonine protein kinase/serine/threonine-protein kinase
MTVLSTQQQAHVNALLDELLDLPADRRSQRLLSRDVDDPAVLSEVQSLLRAASAADGFLRSPARPAVESTSPAAASSGLRLGAWRVTGIIGRGGMGEVYQATRVQGDFEQRGAIKLLQHDASAQLERFQAERQILARFEHPGIARLHDGGVSPDGRPYMVMEFIDGRPITEYCAQTAASLSQRLQLFIQVCEAVAYAHRHLVVHRDLKPSNILVTAEGQVKLLDFGIAKPLDAQQSHLTAAAIAPLTPRCAAPEQLTGKPITTATDVYALGLLLFELLTGAHPWAGADTPVLQVLRTVLQRPAPIASQVAAAENDPPVPAPLIRGDLDAIIAKALRAEPTHRYATVEGLKLDVKRALEGAPVTAREGARLYVLGRMLRRYRWAFAALAAVIVSLAVGLGLAAWQAERAAIERDIARRDAAREEAVRYNLTQLFRSAIADQSAHPATAKSMIDSSAQRVLHEYREQPQLAGQIVLTLADLYGALEDVAGARALLEGFVAQAGTNADPAAVADAQQKLANIELLSGHAEHATQLLDQAAVYWARWPKQYTEERLEGLGIRSRVQRAGGDLDGAIVTSRQAIAQRIALSGHDHRETAILFNSLAITLASANRFDEALAAYHETTAIYRAIGLGDGLDAQIILANTGTLDLRLGHLRDAETLLKSAIERERALAGDSAAVAAALSYYGRLLTITNRNAPAIAVLTEAGALGTRYAGASSPLNVQNQLFLAEAQIAAGDLAGARLTLTSAHDSALAQYGEGHVLTLRAQLAQAQLAAAAGRQAEAQTLLVGVVAGFRHLGSRADANLAQALQQLAEAQLSQGQTQPAIAALQEALALRERSHDQTWELAVVRERLGEAFAAGGNAAAPSLLRQAAQSLEAILGAEHPQTIRARDALAQFRT